MNNTYVITGGAGFIGTNLVHALHAAGAEVTVIDDLSAGDASRLPEGVRFIQASVLDSAQLEKALQGAGAVIHLAALPRVQFSIEQPEVAHRVNVDGTLAVLEAARKAGVKRVVFAASSSAYGDQETMPLSEDMLANPKSPYALHKLIGEQYMKLWSELYDIETVSLRFFNVYGPYLDPDGPYALVIGRFLKLAQEGKPLSITGDGEQTRDFTHVSDVVSAVRAAATVTAVGNGEVLNVGAGAETTINELAKMIGGTIEYVPPRIEPRRTKADITRTSELLDWKPLVQLADGIAELKQEFGLS